MDAADIIAKGKKTEQISIPKEDKTKTLVRMINGASWTTAGGVVFTTREPFQLMEPPEAKLLIDNNPERFKEGHRDELASFYGLE